MQKRKLVLLLIFAIALSCEKDLFLNEVDYEIPKVPDRLTISAKLKSGETPKALVGTSVYILSGNTSINDSNFNVKLFEDGSFIENLSPISTDGYFGGNHIISKNRDYKITISRTGFDDAVGSTSILNSIQITDFTISSDTTKNETYVSLNILDPSQTSDYYYIEPYLIDSNGFSRPVPFTCPDPTMEDFTSNEDILEGLTPKRPYLTRGGFYKDQYFNGQSKKIQLNPSSYYVFIYNKPQAVYLQISHISKSYYEFEKKFRHSW